jgi:hypothetical protein
MDAKYQPTLFAHFRLFIRSDIRLIERTDNIQSGPFDQRQNARDKHQNTAAHARVDGARQSPQ